ncbi:hypothetical protein BC829DRAFT_445602 [Chytridium lagenaria]|nr:hypothetical protein BC829DRAFT_445602 [Chytridium lagenaria]
MNGGAAAKPNVAITAAAPAAAPMTTAKKFQAVPIQPPAPQQPAPVVKVQPEESYRAPPVQRQPESQYHALPVQHQPEQQYHVPVQRQPVEQYHAPVQQRQATEQYHSAPPPQRQPMDQYHASAQQTTQHYHAIPQQRQPMQPFQSAPSYHPQNTPHFHAPPSQHQHSQYNAPSQRHHYATPHQQDHHHDHHPPQPSSNSFQPSQPPKTGIFGSNHIRVFDDARPVSLTGVVPPPMQRMGEGLSSGLIMSVRGGVGGMARTASQVIAGGTMQREDGKVRKIYALPPGGGGAAVVGTGGVNGEDMGKPKTLSERFGTVCALYKFVPYYQMKELDADIPDQDTMGVEGWSQRV